MQSWHGRQAPITSKAARMPPHLPARPSDRLPLAASRPKALKKLPTLQPPWQVNHAPSLTTDTPLDMAVKARLVR